MATTALFVELLVIGAGSAGWVVLAVMTIFGYSWVNRELVTSVLGLIPVLAAVYVLGIVVDRLADRLFRPAADRLLARSFRTREDYERARDLVYLHSSLVDLIEYNRSRLRICRGWVINCGVALVTFDGFIWAQAPSEWPRSKLVTVGTALLALLGAGAFHAWYRLTIDSFQRLSQQAAILREGT